MEYTHAEIGYSEPSSCACQSNMELQTLVNALSWLAKEHVIHSARDFWHHKNNVEVLELKTFQFWIKKQ